MIKLSVIVPIYKVPLEYLRECLDSLVAQTLQECEFIIVSDGAPKGECSVCEDCVKKDSRFKFFNREHVGVSAARNFGMEQAQGEYITFVDGDDWVDVDACEQAFSFADQVKCDVLIYALKEHHSNGKIQTLRPFSQSENKLGAQDANAIVKNTIHIFKHEFVPAICTVCKVYRTSFIRQHGIKYCQDLPIGEDRVFNYEVYAKTKKIAYLDRAFYHYRIWQSSSRNSCNEQTLSYSFLYITKLKELTKGLYDNELGLEAVSEIWQFCSKCSKGNEQIDMIKNTIESDAFQSLVHCVRKTTPHPLVKLDVFAFKRKWTFPIYIHLLQGRMQNWLKSHLL